MTKQTRCGACDIIRMSLLTLLVLLCCSNVTLIISIFLCFNQKTFPIHLCLFLLIPICNHQPIYTYGKPFELKGN